MPELQVIAHHTIREGSEAEVLELLPKLIEATRREPGALRFDAYFNHEEPRSYILYERYVSREAFQAHRASAHFEEYMRNGIVPMLERRVIEAFDVPEGGAEISP